MKRNISCTLWPSNSIPSYIPDRNVHARMPGKCIQEMFTAALFIEPESNMQSEKNSNSPQDCCKGSVSPPWSTQCPARHSYPLGQWRPSFIIICGLHQSGFWLQKQKHKHLFWLDEAKEVIAKMENGAQKKGRNQEVQAAKTQLKSGHWESWVRVFPLHSCC